MEGTHYKGYYIWPYDGYFDVHENEHECGALVELLPTRAAAKAAIDELVKFERLEAGIAKAFRL